MILFADAATAADLEDVGAVDGPAEPFEQWRFVAALDGSADWVVHERLLGGVELHCSGSWVG